MTPIVTSTDYADDTDLFLITTGIRFGQPLGAAILWPLHTVQLLPTLVDLRCQDVEGAQTLGPIRTSAMIKEKSV
jgi:hypothetical protein